MNNREEKWMIELLMSPYDWSKIAEFIEETGLDAVDRDGRTVLHSAVVSNELELVEYLIAKGYDINAADEQGFTALHLAAIHDYQEIARVLIESGANIEAVDSWGNTPLWRAAMNSPEINSETALYLIAQGADVNRKNQSGVAPVDLLHE